MLEQGPRIDFVVTEHLEAVTRRLSWVPPLPPTFGCTAPSEADVVETPEFDIAKCSGENEIIGGEAGIRTRTACFANW